MKVLVRRQYSLSPIYRSICCQFITATQVTQVLALKMPINLFTCLSELRIGFSGQNLPKRPAKRNNETRKEVALTRYFAAFVTY